MVTETSGTNLRERWERRVFRSVCRRRVVGVGGEWMWSFGVGFDVDLLGRVRRRWL